MEFAPEDVSVSTALGNYSCSFVVDETGLTYVRRLEFVKGRYSPESYTELVDFLKMVVKADKQKVVLLKST